MTRERLEQLKHYAAREAEGVRWRAVGSDVKLGDTHFGICFASGPDAAERIAATLNALPRLLLERERAVAALRDSLERGESSWLAVKAALAFVEEEA